MVPSSSSRARCAGRCEGVCCGSSVRGAWLRLMAERCRDLYVRVDMTSDGSNRVGFSWMGRGQGGAGLGRREWNSSVIRTHARLSHDGSSSRATRESGAESPISGGAWAVEARRRTATAGPATPLFTARHLRAPLSILHVLHRPILSTAMSSQ